MLSGHLHRYFNINPTDKVKFPVIDNAHKTVIKAVAESNQLVLEVKDLQGKPVDTIVIPAK